MLVGTARSFVVCGVRLPAMARSTRPGPPSTGPRSSCVTSTGCPMLGTLFVPRGSLPPGAVRGMLLLLDKVWKSGSISSSLTERRSSLKAHRQSAAEVGERRARRRVGTGQGQRDTVLFIVAARIGSGEVLPPQARVGGGGARVAGSTKVSRAHEGR